MDKLPLTPSNVPTKFCCNNQTRFGKKCKHIISDPKKGHHFPRSFEVKFADKVPLTNSNFFIEFHLKNQQMFGEKWKNVISDPKNVRHFPSSRYIKCSLRSNSWTWCPLPLAISLPSFIWITKIDWEKSAKMWFQTLKTPAISQGQGRLRSNSQTMWRLPLVNIATKFRLNNHARKYLEKSAKHVISDP